MEGSKGPVLWRGRRKLEMGKAGHNEALWGEKGKERYEDLHKLRPAKNRATGFLQRS